MFGREAKFVDREDAGRCLSTALMHLKDEKPLVLALPRGGVPVAYQVAEVLRAPLDVVFVRKIGAPHHPELGLGAIVDGATPHTVWNEEVLEQVKPSAEYLEAEQQRQLAEIERRRRAYRGRREPHRIEGRTVILVDDGVATGGTVRAALKALAQSKPARLVLAVPVAPPEVVEALKGEAVSVISLETPDPFHAVGVHYRDFRQTSDEEVVALLRQAEPFELLR